MVGSETITWWGCQPNSESVISVVLECGCGDRERLEEKRGNDGHKGINFSGERDGCVGGLQWLGVF